MTHQEDHPPTTSPANAKPDKVNEWTRNDLPSVIKSHAYSGNYFSRLQEIEAYKDDVVDHLNANHPKPAPVPMGRAANNMLRETLANVERERDRLRRAHAIVEQERDQARSERDEAHVLANRRMGEVHAAQVERDDAYAASALFQRDVHEWRTRAEAAEARTAVTREDVEKAVKGTLDGSNITLPDNLFDAQIDAVCSLFGVKAEPADPAVFVVRESQIAAVKVEQDSHGEWFADGEHVYVDDARQADHIANGYMTKAVRRFAVARAIEADAEPADQVEDKARELYALAHPGVFVPKGDDAELAPFRRLAAHVLGQEAGHE